MNWLYYLAEANLYLCVFYAAYCILLAKETHYVLNRAYLLFSCIAAFALPLLQIGALKPAYLQSVQTVEYVNNQPVQYYPITPVLSKPFQPAMESLNYEQYLWIAYTGGVLVLTFIVLLKLYSIFKLTRKKRSSYGPYKMVYLEDTNVAFSFFNYMFIGTQVSGTSTIVTHELVHIRQKHSADVMFLEFLKIISWFNPVVYLLQNSLKTVHEYIADEKTAAAETDAITYSSFLVSNAYGTGGSSITHSFFNYNLLKKRIIMLNQQRSGNLARLKYLITLPVCAGMLCASTLSFSKTYAWDIGAVKTFKADIESKAHGIFADTLTTPKGYKYTQTIYFKNGQKAARVTFYEQGGKKTVFNSEVMSSGKINVLKEKYGYRFPEGSYPPPPPPEPPKPKVGQVIFRRPQPQKPKVDQVRFPPPIVKPDAKKTVTGQTKVTTMGYVYEEGGFIADNKGDMFVIIYEGGKGQSPVFRSSATAEQVSMLKNKYGYKFPDLKIYSEMPPPAPPVAPGQ